MTRTIRHIPSDTKARLCHQLMHIQLSRFRAWAPLGTLLRLDPAHCGTLELPAEDTGAWSGHSCPLDEYHPFLCATAGVQSTLACHRCHHLSPVCARESRKSGPPMAVLRPGLETMGGSRAMSLDR